jgi:hypothetical protein
MVNLNANMKTITFVVTYMGTLVYGMARCCQGNMGTQPANKKFGG